MDPDLSGSDDDADAMARFMGFSAFGAQGPTKKRKFNPATDAVVDGQELAKLDKGGKKGQGSGGNDIPLGKPRFLGQAKQTLKGNSDEIDLDGGDEDIVETEAALEKTTVKLSNQHDDDDPEPVYIDTSLPPPNRKSRAAQVMIDAILAKSETSEIEPPTKQQSKKPQAPRGLGQYMLALQGPPPVPPPTIQQVQQVQSNNAPRVKEQKNELWYIDYFDQSFNENPWAASEKTKGLEAVGSWVDRAERRP